MRMLLASYRIPLRFVFPSNLDLTKKKSCTQMLLLCNIYTTYSSPIGRNNKYPGHSTLSMPNLLYS